jgi:hypothetical protein
MDVSCFPPAQQIGNEVVFATKFSPSRHYPSASSHEFGERSQVTSLDGSQIELRNSLQNDQPLIQPGASYPFTDIPHQLEFTGSPVRRHTGFPVEFDETQPRREDVSHLDGN